MIQTTFNAAPVLLLNDSPNWSRGYSSDFASPTDKRESLTKRRTGRSYGDSLRVSVKCTITLSGLALRQAQWALRGLKAQPVLMPFWPAVSFWSQYAGMLISGGLYVAFKSDWSNYAIFTPGNEPAWPAAGDLVCPLLWGFLKQTQMTFLNVDTANWPVDFVESSKSDYALSLSYGAFPAGPMPTGYTFAPAILPFKQDHRSSTDSINVTVARESMGFVREQPATFYPHDPYRAQSAQYTISTASNIAALIGWYETVASQGAVFWAASPLSVGYLANGYVSLANAVTLTWADVNIAVGDYICTFNSVGTLLVAKVTAIAVNGASISSVFGDVITGVGGEVLDDVGGGPFTVTINNAFGVAFNSGQPFYALNLATLTDDKLSLKWLSPILVTAKMAWSEVRPEAVLPAGEILGQTIGQLAQRAILFHFWRDYGNGTLQHWYFTNFETDISWDGITYVHAPIDCGEIAYSLNLEDDSAQIIFQLANLDGTINVNIPLIQEVTLTNEVPLNVAIYFADTAVAVAGIGGDAIYGVGGEAVQPVK
jgi:hypothetical protein